MSLIRVLKYAVIIILVIFTVQFFNGSTRQTMSSIARSMLEFWRSTTSYVRDFNLQDDASATAHESTSEFSVKVNRIRDAVNHLAYSDAEEKPASHNSFEPSIDINKHESEMDEAQDGPERARYGDTLAKLDDIDKMLDKEK